MCCWPLVHFVILGTYSDRFQPRRAVEICEMPIVTPTQLPWEDILSWNEGFLLLRSKLTGMLRHPLTRAVTPSSREPQSQPPLILGGPGLVAGCQARAGP